MGLQASLILAATVFCIGLFGVLAYRALLKHLLSQQLVAQVA